MIHSNENLLPTPMRLSPPVTQGGQTFLHRLRMWGQIVRLAFFSSSLISLLTFGILCFYNFTEAHLDLYIKAIAHKLKGLPTPDSKTLHIIHHKIALYGWIALGVGCVFGTLLFLLWQRQGLKAQAKETIAGTAYAPPKDVIKQIAAQKGASPIHLMNLPLIKGTETQHMLITGTTGSGKTNAFKHLLHQIRDQRAVILDTTGEFVEKYYNPETDIIMNPFDKRFPGWNLWAECSEIYHYDEIAESLIPKSGHDPFWAQSSRTLLAEILKHLAQKNKHSFHKILEMSNVISLEELARALHGTKASALIDPKSEKTATSIRMNLAANIGGFEHLLGAHEDRFSIRKWVHDDKRPGWLFLMMTPAQRATLRPLLSCWLSIAIKSLMECSVDSQRHLWFMIDELPSVNKLQDLSLCLAEGRKYGACMVLGVQNIPQIEALYGPHVTQSLLDLCSTKVFFRCASFAMAQKLSHLLGTQERKEVQEGISYGANEIRDGVSLHMHVIEKPIIPAYDLMNLPDLSSYVALPQGYPMTKIKWDYAV